MTDEDILETVKHYAPHWCDRCAIFYGATLCPLCALELEYARERNRADVWQQRCEMKEQQLTEAEVATERWRTTSMNDTQEGSLAHERALKAERVRDELQALIDKQHERTAVADAAWQEATGRHNTTPDLGALIEWLQDRAE